MAGSSPSHDGDGGGVGGQDHGTFQLLLLLLLLLVMVRRLGSCSVLLRRGGEEGSQLLMLLLLLLAAPLQAVQLDQVEPVLVCRAVAVAQSGKIERKNG